MSHITHSTTDAVAAELRAALARKQISQRQLAADLGIDHTYVARRFNGSTAVSVSDLIWFSRAAGFDPVEIVASAVRREATA